MLLSDFESEDIALLASISITALIVFIDTVYGSPIFKALKIISVILSVG